MLSIFLFIIFVPELIKQIFFLMLLQILVIVPTLFFSTAVYLGIFFYF